MLDVPCVGFLASVVAATFDGDRNLVSAALSDTPVPKHTEPFRRKLAEKSVIGVLVPAPNDHCQLLRIHAGGVSRVFGAPLSRARPWPIPSY